MTIYVLEWVDYLFHWYMLASVVGTLVLTYMGEVDCEGNTRTGYITLEAGGGAGRGER